MQCQNNCILPFYKEDIILLLLSNFSTILDLESSYSTLRQIASPKKFLNQDRRLFQKSWLVLKKTNLSPLNPIKKGEERLKKSPLKMGIKNF